MCDFWQNRRVAILKWHCRCHPSWVRTGALSPCRWSLPHTSTQHSAERSGGFVQSPIAHNGQNRYLVCVHNPFLIKHLSVISLRASPCTVSRGGNTSRPDDAGVFPNRISPRRAGRFSHGRNALQLSRGSGALQKNTILPRARKDEGFRQENNVLCIHAL